MRSQFLYACLVLLTACDGTRTGNPIGDDNAMQPDGGMKTGTAETGNGGLAFAGGNCKATPSALDALDQDTPLGFSAVDVLAFAGGEHKTKIRWQSNDGIGSATPESGEHSLTLRIQPTSAKPRFVAYEEAPQMDNGLNSGGLLDIGPPLGGCESNNALEIDVTLVIQSDGGALDENLKGTLRATNTSWATLDIVVAAEDLSGSLQIVAPKVGDLMFTFKQLSISLGLSPLGVRGQLGGTFESDSESGPNSGSGVGTSSAAGGGGIAEIGADDQCDPDGLSVELDQKLKQFDAQDAIDLVNAAPPLALQWQNGSKTTFDLTFMQGDAAVCAVVQPNVLSAPNDAGLFRLRGTLSVSTDDDRVDGDWPVVIEAKPAIDGTLGDVSVQFDGPNLSQSPIRDLAGEYGIHGIDASGYDGANIMFSLQFAASTTHDVTGMLTVSGLTQPMCPPPPTDPNMGTSGCRGIDLTTLDSATLSAPAP